MERVERPGVLSAPGQLDESWGTAPSRFDIRLSEAESCIFVPACKRDRKSASEERPRLLVTRSFIKELKEVQGGS
jgi:hypothetical protein